MKSLYIAYTLIDEENAVTDLWHTHDLKAAIGQAIRDVKAHTAAEPRQIEQARRCFEVFEEISIDGVTFGVKVSRELE